MLWGRRRASPAQRLLQADSADRHLCRSQDNMSLSLRTPAAAPRMLGAVQEAGVFCVRARRQEWRGGPEKGKSPREIIPPTATCRAGPTTPHVNLVTD